MPVIMWSRCDVTIFSFASAGLTGPDDLSLIFSLRPGRRSLRPVRRLAGLLRAHSRHGEIDGDTIAGLDAFQGRRGEMELHRTLGGLDVDPALLRVHLGYGAFHRVLAHGRVRLGRRSLLGRRSRLGRRRRLSGRRRDVSGWARDSYEYRHR